MIVIKKIIRKLYHLILFHSLFFIFILPTNASVVNYQFFGKYVGDTFNISANSTSTARTYFNVTGDSTRNYLVVDICSTTHLDSSVPNDYDGSYSTFVKEYDTKTSCIVNNYNGSLIRLFYYIRTWADSGNGNMAFNNNTSLTNLFSWNGVYKLVSVGLSDDMDVGDLLVNNQNIIINSITNIQGSINSSSSSINGNINSSSSSINGNINQKSEDIINNQNQTSGSIITNQNENTDKQINSQKVCNLIDKSSIIINNTILEQNGSTSTSSTGYGITDYLKITSADITSLSSVSSTLPSLCFYNVNKSLISCINNNTLSANTKVNIPSNATYVRFTININTNQPQFKICTDGNQALYDSFNDSDSSGASSEASEFFNSFSTDTFGLTSIVTAPLNLIQSLTSSTCSNLLIPIPFVSNKYLELPCMTPIYQSYFGILFTLYQSITYGIIAYWVCVRIFNQVKDFKNPEHDEIEVLDL